MHRNTHCYVYIAQHCLFLLVYCVCLGGWVDVCVCVCVCVCHHLTMLVLASFWLKNVTDNSKIASKSYQGASRAATFRNFSYNEPPLI